MLSLVEILNYMKKNYQTFKEKIWENKSFNPEEEAFSLTIQILEEKINTNNGWISCDENLPKNGDNRFYQCLVENHTDDLPAYYQFDEEYGFGIWKDYYDKGTSEFSTTDEMGEEKVLYWREIPCLPENED